MQSQFAGIPPALWQSQSPQTTTPDPWESEGGDSDIQFVPSFPPIHPPAPVAVKPSFTSPGAVQLQLQSGMVVMSSEDLKGLFDSFGDLAIKLSHSTGHQLSPQSQTTLKDDPIALALVGIGSLALFCIGSFALITSANTTPTAVQQQQNQLMINAIQAESRRTNSIAQKAIDKKGNDTCISFWCGDRK